MTTDRQRRANAVNAGKSTGPRTPHGKSVAARNARRHGLTGPPPWDDVTRFFRVIMNDPGAVPDAMSRDIRAQAALALAETEAQCARCVMAERDLLGGGPDREQDATRMSAIDILGKAVREGLEISDLHNLLEQTTGRGAEGTLEAMGQQDLNRSSETDRQWRTLRRYRREAEARRRKALRHWIAVQKGGSVAG